MSKGGFTLLELLAAVAIVGLLAVITTGAARKVHESSSLAVSANNIRQLAAGGISYLAENDNVFWRFRGPAPAGQTGVTWWFGFEPATSLGAREGSREFDPALGPLGGYVPKGIRPDPSFALGGSAFKPKYRNGYLGTGYNALLGGGFLGALPRAHRFQLSDPSQTVVFFTSAQVNTFQPPASSRAPMLEEFYGIDDREVTVHFRHNGKALVSFATGNVGFLEMDESTRDRRMPRANVGRFAPVGDTRYLR
ncbi:MAG: type II secretion system protein [Terrimicrobiaceae bacterium]|nr:type II secretion system protein [Terrimicrobiaceae bacterium]